MKRLKILSVLDGFSYGGDENRVLQLAQAIDRDRFDFRVATIRPSNSKIDERFGNLRGEFEASGVRVVDLSVPRKTAGLALTDVRRYFLRVGMLVATVARIISYVRREKIDVLDGHQGAGYLATTIAGVLTGVPRLLTTYNVSEAWSPRILWHIIHRLTLANSGAVITDSDVVANTLRSWMLPAHRSRVRVIPNGPPPPIPMRSEQHVRTMLGLQPAGASRVVGQIAALCPGKGQHLSIEAAPRVLEQHPDVTFLLVGFERPTAGYAAVLRARAKELGVEKNVVVASYQGHIGDVWQVVDIQSHPTMQDSLPNAILEGMSLGKPMVTSDFAGIPTLVLNDRTGVVVPTNDSQALADGLIRLLDAPSVARDMGDAAQRRYNTGYTREILARRMQEVFTELAGSRAV